MSPACISANRMADRVSTQWRSTRGMVAAFSALPASMGHRARYMDTMSTEAVVVLTLRPMLRVRTTPTPGIPAMNIQSPTGLLTG